MCSLFSSRLDGRTQGLLRAVSAQLCSVSFRCRSPLMHGRSLDWIEEWCCIFFFTSLPRSGGKPANHTHYAERGSHTHALAQDTAAGIKGCSFGLFPHKNCSLCFLINLTVNSFHFLGLLRTPARYVGWFGFWPCLGWLVGLVGRTEIEAETDKHICPNICVLRGSSGDRPIFYLISRLIFYYIFVGRS